MLSHPPSRWKQARAVCANLFTRHFTIYVHKAEQTRRDVIINAPASMSWDFLGKPSPSDSFRKRMLIRRLNVKGRYVKLFVMQFKSVSMMIKCQKYIDNVVYRRQNIVYEYHMYRRQRVCFTNCHEIWNSDIFQKYIFQEYFRAHVDVSARYCDPNNFDIRRRDVYVSTFRCTCRMRDVYSRFTRDGTCEQHVSRANAVRCRHFLLRDTLLAFLRYIYI